jgi:hypothetical protein
MFNQVLIKNHLMHLIPMQRACANLDHIVPKSLRHPVGNPNSHFLGSLNKPLLGLAAYELAQALTSLHDKNSNKAEIIDLLEEAVQILQYDPTDNNYGRLATLAQNELDNAKK